MNDIGTPVIVYDMRVDGRVTCDVTIIEDLNDKTFKCYMLVAQFDNIEAAKEAAKEIYLTMGDAAPII